LLLSFAGSATPIVGARSSLAQNTRLEQGVSRKALAGLLLRRRAAIGQATVARRSGAVHRFALAIGALPMLETARIGGDAGSL
jgi:hypothetical protein